jgi:TRAP-type C4-dicarboxylate transport system permease large subunit
MARSKSTLQTIVAIVLMVVGAGLAYWGYQQSGSIGSQMTQAVTGSHSDKVMTLYIAAAASLAVGIFLFFKR